MRKASGWDTDEIKLVTGGYILLVVKLIRFTEELILFGLLLSVFEMFHLTCF